MFQNYLKPEFAGTNSKNQKKPSRAVHSNPSTPIPILITANSPQLTNPPNHTHSPRPAARTNHPPREPAARTNHPAREPAAPNHPPRDPKQT